MTEYDGSFYGFLARQAISKYNHLINEGLINSVSYTIFEEKLRDLLNKYEIEFEINRLPEYIKLDIVVKKNKFLYNDLISLLNLCGYYISTYVGDDEKEEKTLDIYAYMNNKSLTIFFNKKYDFEESGIKVFMYHVTDSSLKNKILKDGLVAKSKKKIENHPERIYLFDSLNDAKEFAEEIRTNLGVDFMSKEIKPIILKVDMRIVKNIKLYTDPKYPNKDAYYTYDNISFMALKEIILEKDQ
jgi:hypothetical protein